MARLVRQLLDDEFSSHQHTRAAGSQQARTRGPAEGLQNNEAPVPEERPASGSVAVTGREQESSAGPLGLPPGGDRVNGAERGQHRQATEVGVAVDGGDRTGSKSAPEMSASPAPSETTAALGMEVSTSPAGSGSGFGLSPEGARASRRRTEPGDDGRGGGCPTADPEVASAAGTGDRQRAAPAETSTTTRQRFRGDMRQFVMIHSKTD